MADTVSTKSTNDDTAQTTIGQEHVTQDVNTDEALSVSNATMNAMSQLNMKRTYDLHQTMDTDAILSARRLQNSEAELRLREAEMRMRHTEDQHKQALRHAETEHVIKTQTLQVGATGNSKIIEEIATSTADEIKAVASARIRELTGT